MELVNRRRKMSKKKLFLVLALALCLLVVIFGVLFLFTEALLFERTSVYWIGEGIRAYKVGKYDQVVEHYNKALRIDAYGIDGWNFRRAALDHIPSKPQWLTYDNTYYSFSFQVPWDWIIGGMATRREAVISSIPHNPKFDIPFTKCKNPRMTIYEHESTFECEDNFSLAPIAGIILIEYPIKIDFDKESFQYLNESKKDTKLMITDIEKTTINGHEARLISFSRAKRKGIEAWVKCNDKRIISITCSSLSSEFDQYQEKCLHIVNSLRCG
jgi:tetratricopeptide (TPR) repeat protein